MATDQLEAILAQARQLSPDELAQLIKQAIDLLAQSKRPIKTAPRYAALFGSGKGTFATPEDVDLFVRGEREKWEQ